MFVLSLVLVFMLMFMVMFAFRFLSPFRSPSPMILMSMKQIMGMQVSVSGCPV